eukprot:TRINITY_DN10480_c0_g1_i1.p1 TRINITY_DN10480_c0_g1~~TRINITY_DN10480_c0_g1_i1.p1  ORF type:complete len:232 (+),score=47.98 TRINITY_DN10480_c0_g1_i1:138-833(+)
MPKSKRNKLVTLSKTQKKGKEHKAALVKKLRDSVDQYKSLYIFSYENMRNSKFKELKLKLKTSSRFILGGNKVLRVALGRSEADEIKDGIHQASDVLHGDCGVMLTNLPKEEVSKLFDNFEELDYARTGSIATQTVELKEGPLEQFSHDMEPFLRKQGMPVRLNRGVIELVADHTVCTEGDQISPEASRILRLLGVQMAAFRLHLICRWNPDEFEVYEGTEISVDRPLNGS